LLCNWLIFSFNSSFFSKINFNCFAFFLWLFYIKIQYLLSCKIRFHWLQNSFNILIIWLSWLAIHWYNYFLFFMFHDVVTSSISTETLMSKSETFLLIMLLNRWVVQNLIDLTSCIMMIVDKSCWDKNKWEIDVLI